MTDKPTYEQLERRLALSEQSNEALRNKIRRINHISKNRLNRMKQRTKLLIEARATIARLQAEAHGG
jgi:hypothetical protein